MSSSSGVINALGVEPKVLGSITPRIWTPPLVTGQPGPCGCGCALTPDNSEGFDWVEFAAGSLHQEPYPWQRWLAIHGGELLPDGRPRFRYVWVMVARQNGKTEVPVMLSGYWLFVAAVPMILGTSTKLDYAKESWHKLVKLINKSKDPGVRRMKPARRWTREANGEQEAWCYATDDLDPSDLSRYKIAASNEEGGRSLTVHRGICDEIRQHYDYSAWGAIDDAMNAVPDAQLWALSNAGSDRSIVLNEARAEALEFIETGQGDYRTGWFEWSSLLGADPRDPGALAMANPQFNRTIDGEAMIAKGAKAFKAGGQKLAVFQTESMCIRVPMLDPAVDSAAWLRCLDVGDLLTVRSRVALCLDIAPDGLHATLVAAAVLDDGRARVEPVAAWDGIGCTDRLRRELPGHLARVKPQVLGWFPNGPAAVFAADMRKRLGWPPAGVTLAEIKGVEPAAVCMGFAEQVTAARVAHSGDPLLDAHVGGAERLMSGSTWVFSRRGRGHCDGAYAAAGAVHLARTLPPAVGKPRLLVAP